jgi:hypothetical protein
MKCIHSLNIFYFTFGQLFYGMLDFLALGQSNSGKNYKADAGTSPATE